MRLGRAADNDVAIANQRVSRYHAQLRWVESSWLVYDLDSTNGTLVDQERVFPSQPRALSAGAALRLGDHELEVAESSADSAGRAAMDLLDLAILALRLVLVALLYVFLATVLRLTTRGLRAAPAPLPPSPAPASAPRASRLQLVVLEPGAVVAQRRAR